MKQNAELRFKNPFRLALVTELIEDPARYRRMFSESILVGATLEVFQRLNVVVLGPQGCGKSMILNLIKLNVLSEYLRPRGGLPGPLRFVEPYFGISVNLVRSLFHAFGRRSISATVGRGELDENLEASAAADFLNHFLFSEFLRGLGSLREEDGKGLARWLRIDPKEVTSPRVAEELGSWPCWSGYYSKCGRLEDLAARCHERIDTWRRFLNTSLDSIPQEILRTKTTLEQPLHQMGNLLRRLSGLEHGVPLFVVVDQYEALTELNPRFGTVLRRIVHSLIKARDPVVFLKVGARPYDWGSEVRVWGADSRIEIQRDYSVVDLSEVLMRSEDSAGWLFPDFASDVARKRLEAEGFPNSKGAVEQMLGVWDVKKEVTHYARRARAAKLYIRGLPEPLRREVEVVVDSNEGGELEYRLASAWALQRLQRGEAASAVAAKLKSLPWRAEWWRKERTEIALLQVASFSNQRRRYFGWNTLVALAGFNINCFLLLLAEVWDAAAKLGRDPLKGRPLNVQVQTQGVLAASERWAERERKEETTGGALRYAALCRIAPALRQQLLDDLGISNPGFTGFSLTVPDLVGASGGGLVYDFLQKGVNWAVLEERSHTSKKRGDPSRRKWYLHPLLSPVFGIPFKRVKEPLYVEAAELQSWLFGAGHVVFPHRKGSRGSRTGMGGADEGTQGDLPFGEEPR